MKTKTFTLSIMHKKSLPVFLFFTLLSGIGGKAQCVANFSYTIGPNGSLQVASTSSNLSNPVSYAWSFGDGFFHYGTPTASHTYSYPGNFAVGLAIFDSLSLCNSMITQTLNVSSAPCATPSVGFFSRQDSLVAHSWKVIPHYPGNISGATWSWGDGNTSNGLYPSHTYSAAGLYTICVTITVSCGTTNTYCHSTYVSRPSQGIDNSMIEVHVVSEGPTGIKTNTAEQLQAVIHPNPSSTEAYLQFNGDKPGKHTLVIRDISGKVLLTKQIRTEKGANTIPLESAGLKAGLYFVTLSNDTQSTNLRMVKN